MIALFKASSVSHIHTRTHTHTQRDQPISSLLTLNFSIFTVLQHPSLTRSLSVCLSRALSGSDADVNVCHWMCVARKMVHSAGNTLIALGDFMRTLHQLHFYSYQVFALELYPYSYGKLCGYRYAFFDVWTYWYYILDYTQSSLPVEMTVLIFCK